MKKITLLSALSLSALFLSGCSQVKKPVATTSDNNLNYVTDSVDIEHSAISEYTHEMAEADADDQSIKREVGEAEIDDELPNSEDSKVPYARHFLMKKNTKRMQFWVDYFTKKNRERFQRFINNGEEYRHHIEAIFEAHGLPKELYFVGLIESGYYLGAKSHASAVGPWQFIKGTGSRYGLKISSELDERQDLFKASKAAAMYFKDLHNVFSSWELALAAYNAGEYGIIRRIMKHGTRDFYELSRNKQLPSETINYVPKVLAAWHIINNAEKYGFNIPKKKHRLFDLTELKAIKKNVPLSTIAKRLNVSTELLRKLNPELKRNATPRHFSGNYYLRIPQSKYSYNLDSLSAAPVMASTFNKPESRKELNRRTAEAKEVKAVPQNDMTDLPKSYRVTRGDTLVSIANKFNMKAGELALMNGFKTWRTRVKVGQTLTIQESNNRTVATTTVRRKVAKIKVTNAPIVYKVKRGDNLTNLAKVFDLNVSKIKQANKLKRNQIQVGQKIVLPDTKKGIYTVKKGDHLMKVAREFNQPLDALIKINSLKAENIYPGQKIIVNID